MQRKKTSSEEGKLQDEICQYLDGKRYFNATWVRDKSKELILSHPAKFPFLGIFWRQNTAPTVQKGADGQMRFRKMGKYALPGIPDICVVREKAYDYSDRGSFVGIECKKPGGKQSDWQKIFQKYSPGIYILATSLDDVKEYL